MIKIKDDFIPLDQHETLLAKCKASGEIHKKNGMIYTPPFFTNGFIVQNTHILSALSIALLLSYLWEKKIPKLSQSP